jgi:phosphotransferase system enzyme I (PtsP)
MIRSDFPSEEEQYAIYSRLLYDMRGKPVTFRTLDIGGDKVLSYYEFPKEENPFLGMRSIRFSLRHQEIFKQQIRAILRAGAGRPVKIMFPMISSVDEFRQARGLVEQSIRELKDEGIPCSDAPELGIMIEIPSAVCMIDELARESDFLSIGTNDLIQYTLAVDRTNEKVSDLYIPYHPAVLKSLKIVADAAIRAGIDVSICGDMANSCRYIQFLLGIGIRTLSVDGMYITRVKREIIVTDMESARGMAADALSLDTIEDIAKIFKK